MTTPSPPSASSTQAPDAMLRRALVQRASMSGIRFRFVARWKPLRCHPQRGDRQTLDRKPRARRRPKVRSEPDQVVEFSSPGSSDERLDLPRPEAQVNVWVLRITQGDHVAVTRELHASTRAVAGKGLDPEKAQPFGRFHLTSFFRGKCSRGSARV